MIEIFGKKIYYNFELSTMKNIIIFLVICSSVSLVFGGSNGLTL